MIDVYYGEFLINPCPLELSLNYCSHRCSYCFANLNKPDRVLNTRQLMRFLSNFQNRHTLAALLLQMRYPVVISNRVDPFASSNYLQTLPILEILTRLKIPIQFQTRGGKGIERALEIVGPSVWYISLPIPDEALRKIIEPGAPTIDSRFELIETLTQRGHKVVIGLNPCVPEWCPDPAPALARAAAAGAWGVWVERLHLNPAQIANMTETEQTAIGPALIKRAKKRKTAPQDEDHFHLTRKIALEIGLNVFSVGQPGPSDFFQVYRECYPLTFPIMQDWINHCYQMALYPDNLLDYGQFYGFLGPHLPPGIHSLAHYLGATSRTLWRKRSIPHKMSYDQLLRIIWEEPGSKFSPARLPNFAYAGLVESGGWVQLTDENDLPYMVFSTREQARYYQDVRD